MPSAETKAALRDAATEALEGKASSLTMQRILGIISQLSDSPSAIEADLKRIKIAVQMFVHEGVAQDLHDRLSRLASP